MTTTTTIPAPSTPPDCRWVARTFRDMAHHVETGCTCWRQTVLNFEEAFKDSAIVRRPDWMAGVAALGRKYRGRAGGTADAVSLFLSFAREYETAAATMEQQT